MMVCKYKETDLFHFHNANPKGKNANDCVARAISVALGQTWEYTIREMTELGIKLGLAFNEDKLIDKYLRDKGWEKYNEPRDSANKKLSVAQFVNKPGNYKGNKGVIIAKVGSHHVSLIIDGIVWDTWDCSKNTMHVYWRLPGQTAADSQIAAELVEEYKEVKKARESGIKRRFTL